MPTYEYQCPSCGNHFEKFQSFSDEPVKECPNCGQPVKKVFSAAGIIFKGSGWYINDSKKAATVPVPAKDKEKTDATKTEAPVAEAKTDGAASTETKTEPKAEPKTEAKPASDKAKSEAA